MANNSRDQSANFGIFMVLSCDEAEKDGEGGREGWGEREGGEGEGEGEGGRGRGRGRGRERERERERDTIFLRELTS